MYGAPLLATMAGYRAEAYSEASAKRRVMNLVQKDNPHPGAPRDRIWSFANSLDAHASSRQALILTAVFLQGDGGPQVAGSELSARLFFVARKICMNRDHASISLPGRRPRFWRSTLVRS